MNPLAFLSPYKLLIELAVIGALLAFAGVQLHRFMDHEQQIGYGRAVGEYNAKLVAQQQAAIEKQQALQKQLEDAQNAATEREQVIRSTAAAASAASVSLRDALTTIRAGVPTASVDALRKSTATLATVLDQCQGAYRDMAEKADRHASDVKTLQDAWPK